MNAAGQLQFDHPLFDTFDLVRITHEDLDIGGRFTRNLTAINGVMSFRVRDGHCLDGQGTGDQRAGDADGRAASPRATTLIDTVPTLP